MVSNELVTSLVRFYGSPLYVYQLIDVARAHARLRTSLPDATVIYFSLKANPHPDLVEALARHGCRAEISSPGELATALDVGVAPRDCLYTGPGKTAQEIADALCAGVRRFSVESLGELDRLETAARELGTEVDCLLRINTHHTAGAGVRMGGKPSPFGIDVNVLAAEATRWQRPGAARVVGLHHFPVSNTTDPQALLAAFGAGAAAARQLFHNAGIPLTQVDLGGGFAAPYAAPGDPPDYGPDLHAGFARLLDEHLPGWQSGSPEVAVESGRALVGAAGTLVCSVIDVKQSGDRTFVVLDTGINHVGGLSGIGRLLPASVRPEVHGAHDRPRVTVDLVGPLCTPADVLARGIELPLPRPGDLLCIPNTGAYGLTAAVVAFLGRTPPVEVVLEGEEVRSVSAMQLRRTVIGLES